MIEKVKIVHDPSVYQMLERQVRFNRKMKWFAFAVSIYILSKEIQSRMVEQEGE